jgi:hypothetical protein
MRAPDDRQKIWDDPAQLEEWTFRALHLADLKRLRRARINPEEDGRIDLPEDYADPRRALSLQLINEERDFSRQIRDGLRRAKRRDEDWYYQTITDSPDLVGYLRNKRGRPRGYADEVAAAWAEVGEIRALWKQAFGKKYRKGRRTYREGRTFSLAIEIAAERYGLDDPVELDNYRKNRVKLKRHKSPSN